MSRERDVCHLFYVHTRVCQTNTCYYFELMGAEARECDERGKETLSKRTILLTRTF